MPTIKQSSRWPGILVQKDVGMMAKCIKTKEGNFEKEAVHLKDRFNNFSVVSYYFFG